MWESPSTLYQNFSTMKSKDIIKINDKALTSFNKMIQVGNDLAKSGEHRAAEWFDTPEKRLEWWLDLEPQWRLAFSEAVFMQRKNKSAKEYQPTDEELIFLFEQKKIYVCGKGKFKHRNNSPDISFQLTNLSGLKNLTNLTRIECDFNGKITSLEPLRHLVNLKVLWADNNQIVDLSPLMELPNLERLCIWNNQIKSIEPVLSMLSLYELTIGLYDQGNPVETLAPLKHATNLKSLHIGKVDYVGLKELDGVGFYVSNW